MATATEVRARADAAGITLELRHGQIHMTGRGPRPTPDLLAELRTHRAELQATLEAEAQALTLLRHHFPGAWLVDTHGRPQSLAGATNGC